MDELQKRIEKDLKQLRETPEIIDHFKLYDAWIKKHIEEYYETVESLKHYFAQRGYALPRNWGELFHKWAWDAPEGSDIREVLKSSPEKRKISELDAIPREYFVEWAKAETDRLDKTLKKIDKPSEPEKGETNAVKYLLLDHFFDLKSEFKDLLTKDQEKLLGFILGCRPDTAKSIRNNSGKPKPDGKHITDKAFKRFTELSEKIKKGEIL